MSTPTPCPSSRPHPAHAYKRETPTPVLGTVTTEHQCPGVAVRHRLSVLVDAWGHTARCGCGWQGTTMVSGPHSHQAAIDQYAGHLRSVREGRRQGVTR